MNVPYYINKGKYFIYFFLCLTFESAQPIFLGGKGGEREGGRSQREEMRPRAWGRVITWDACILRLASRQAFVKRVEQGISFDLCCHLLSYATTLESSWMKSGQLFNGIVRKMGYFKFKTRNVPCCGIEM